jgi:hypothetical protein
MLLIKFPPGLILITVIQELATGGIKIEPFLHLVGIDPGVIVEPHPVFGVYFGIVVFLSRGPGGEKPLIDWVGSIIHNPCTPLIA